MMTFLALVVSVLLPTAEARESKEARATDGGTFAILAEPAGLYDHVSVMQYGARVSYRTGNVIEYELAHHRLNGGTFEGGYWRMKGETTSLVVRRYVGPTLYLALGPVFREIEIEHDNFSRVAADSEGNDSYEPVTIGGRKSDLSLQISLGNRWQWRKFILGVDWVGFAKVAYTFTEQQNVSRADTSDSGQDAYENYGNVGVLHGVRLYLGWAL